MQNPRGQEKEDAHAFVRRLKKEKEERSKNVKDMTTAKD